MPKRFLNVICSALLTASSVRVNAEELRIGHLEATDDIGIDWQHYSCETRNNVLYCHIFQTLINHEINPKDREKAISEKLAGMTPESFKAEMGDGCRNASAVRATIEDKLATGKKPDGSPMSKQETMDIKAAFADLEDACKNTTPENLRRFVEHGVDKSIRTCVIQNQHFEDTFKWNGNMKAWESRSKEYGPCGNTTETRLMRDPAFPTYWLSEERHIYATRNGVLPDGRSCSIFPAEKTYHFTWRAADNSVDCTYIKNNMAD